MKTVVLTQSFFQSPDRVLKRYLDRKTYRGPAGGKVSIQDEVGGKFRIGDRKGKILRRGKRGMVIHTLRYDGWEKGVPDAVVVGTAEGKDGRTSFRLSVVNIPDDWVERIKGDCRAALEAMRSRQATAREDGDSSPVAEAAAEAT